MISSHHAINSDPGNATRSGLTSDGYHLGLLPGNSTQSELLNVPIKLYKIYLVKPSLCCLKFSEVLDNSDVSQDGSQCLLYELIPLLT